MPPTRLAFSFHNLIFKRRTWRKSATNPVHHPSNTLQPIVHNKSTMAGPPLVEDDTTYNGDNTVDDTYASTQYTSSTTHHPNFGNKKQNVILSKLFMTCENDALGSVHRAWAVTVLFMVVFFIVAIIEGECCIM